MFGNAVLQYIAVQGLWHLFSWTLSLCSPATLGLVKLCAEIWLIKLDCHVHLPSVNLTTPADVMVMPPTVLMALISSKTPTVTTWAQLDLATFQGFSVSTFTSLGLQEWHINLITSVCVQLVSIKSVHFLSFQIVSCWHCLILHFLEDQVDNFWGASMALWCNKPSLITLKHLILQVDWCGQSISKQHWRSRWVPC